MNNSVSFKKPVFFQHNRVWRCYIGGALLDRFCEDHSAGDNNFPEDWLASTTMANNGPNRQSQDEGLARVRMPDGSNGPLFRDLLAADPRRALGRMSYNNKEGVGVLCKFLDSAVRLPIQCHPDRAFASEHYNSEHGKAESWIVLDTREIDGEQPYLLLGFKPDVNPSAFKKAVRNQDVSVMVNSLHRIPVAPGDIYFIPGRVPHAIGAGVFLLEVQEPTDWVVQPERFIGGTELSDIDMWGPLTPEVGLKCFDYKGADSQENITGRLRLEPEIIWQDKEGQLETIIGPETTPCFRVDRLTISKSLEFSYNAPWYIAIITKGHGEVACDEGVDAIRPGDYFFVSNKIEALHYKAKDGPLAVYLVSKD